MRTAIPNQSKSSFQTGRKIALAIVLFLAATHNLHWKALAQYGRQSGDKITNLSPDARRRIRQAIKAIGMVLVRNKNDAGPEPRPRGSAVVVRKDGVVVTNYHVVEYEKLYKLYDELYLRLPDDGTITSASPRYRLVPLVLDKDRDLALLRAVAESGKDKESSELSLPALALGDSKKIEPLEELVIIGFPEKGGASVTVNPGMVEGQDAAGGWIKTDARLIHGNSGGAAVNIEGQLIGVPTKVVVDGDNNRLYGAVGYLRPAHLVAAMLDELQKMETKPVSLPSAESQRVQPGAEGQSRRFRAVLVTGEVRSTVDNQPIAGARVGLLPLGRALTETNLVAWGGTNPEGRFEMNKLIPSGRYTIRAKVIGYEPHTSEVEVGPGNAPLVIKLRPISK